jgi:hypothetical protein
MSWTDFFRSRYVRFLEQELAAVRKKHAEETATLKNTHAEELNRCINEANRGWAEADRLRLFLVPGLPAANRVTESADKEPPVAEQGETGTPWQRIMQREMKRQELEAAAEEAKRRAQAFPTPPKEKQETPNAPSN